VGDGKGGSWLQGCQCTSKKQGSGVVREVQPVTLSTARARVEGGTCGETSSVSST
jgi:hypothetical protein